jgi:hypothetical protein
VLGRLRREVEALKRKLHTAEREWNEVRKRDIDGDLMALAGEKYK